MSAASARVLVLGTGTSHGVPMIGCECATCLSTDPRDKRSRASILIQTDGPAVLVDTTTDLRMQALAHGIKRVDAIVYTHSHADHVMGLDEVRRFNVMQKSAIPCYGDARTLADLRRIYSYIFSPHTHRGGGIPQVVLAQIAGEFCIGPATLVPVPLVHGARTIFGYRIGSFAYLTDCSAIPDASWPLLSGVRTVVLDALRERPHPTHMSLEQALATVAKLGPERAFFTHMCHDLPHAATCARLPAGVELAYDGLAFEIDL
ncbi:MAG: MBL fold metallo-hydrolase [Acidobacteria bacterium]|nr:MAG: MBL fold metallo-hydrolase [Acidobacteriota bacterium]